MPTIYTINNKWRVMIRTDDHTPPHVHVVYGKGSQCHAKIELETLRVSQVKNFSLRELNMILDSIESRIDVLLDQWEFIHGK